MSALALTRSLTSLNTGKFLRISASLMGSNEMDVSAANQKLLIELVIGTVTFLERIEIDLKPWNEGATWPDR